MGGYKEIIVVLIICDGSIAPKAIVHIVDMMQWYFAACISHLTLVRCHLLTDGV